MIRKLLLAMNLVGWCDQHPTLFYFSPAFIFGLYVLWLHCHCEERVTTAQQVNNKVHE